MTFVTSNIFKIGDRTVEEISYDRLIDYLLEKYPNGFDKPCDIYVNEKKIVLDDYDIELKDDDIIIIMFRPALAVGVVGGSVVTFIANLFISAAVSYIIGQIFKPKIPNMQTSLASRNSAGQASSVYSLNSQQNEAKVGQVIPIIYGKVRTYPALIAPPYYRYENNEEYLYQLMCIGQGKYAIDDLLISDTNVQEIQSDYFRYEKLEHDDFKTPALFNTKVNDSNYHQLIKTIPDVENLEIRGTPQNQSMVMRFENSTITFYPYANGDEPDLSSLSNGSTITISNTVSNNGIYTVDSVTANVVTVQTHTFVTEPDGVIATDGSYAITTKDGEDTFVETSGENVVILYNLAISTCFRVGVIDYTVKRHLLVTGYPLDARYTFTSPSPLLSVSGDVYIRGKLYTAEFETGYGAYLYDKSHIGFEIDYHYPAGVYNSNSTTGALEDRTTQFNINYTEAGTPTDEVIQTIARDNSAIRATYKHIYTVPQSTANIKIKRITAEPSNVQSMDKTYIKSIKFIHADPDYEPLNNITLLWCKIRASNAISSIGQFAINAWVTRSDLLSDVKSVITDLYSNDVYGGRLPIADLNLIDTLDTSVNGAIDSKMTLYDAMQMTAKSNRYNVYPSGSEIKLKHDAIKPIRTALYNETNIIKDSLKISYLFTEQDETDSIKIIYRDSDEFKEATVIYPTDGIFPEEIELWGCTDGVKALEMATYLYKQDKARRKSVEFKTDIQGLIPEFLDRIAISHNLPEWGIGGQISYINGNYITLTCSYDLSDGIYDSIIFRKEDASVSDILSMVVVDSNTIEILGTVPTWLYDGEEFDKTNFSMGISNTFVKDYIVISIKPSGNEITITATNYDETIY